MKNLGIVTVTVLGLCCLLLPSQAIGQDFNQLLEAVDRLEASLKTAVEQESVLRKIEMKAVWVELAALKGQSPTGANNGDLAALKKQLNQLNRKLTKMPVGGPSGTDEQALMPLANDIEFLKAEIVLLRSFFEKNRNVLASLNNNVAIPSSNQGWTHEDQNFSSGVTFSGFVDASDFNNHNSGEASFSLDQMELDVIKEFSNQASLRADIEYVSDGAGGFSMDLEQGYLTYSLGHSQRWTFSFGKFNAPIGFELLDAPDMFQYSHALVFDLGLPTNLTGLMISTEFPAVVDWSFYLVNGWDVNTDNNKDKTFGTRIGITPVDNLNFGISVISGAEQDDNNSSRRTVLDLDITYNPLQMWTLGGEFNLGNETKTLADGTTGNWSGFLFMSNLAFSDRFGLTTRFDYFSDADGLRTGTVQDAKAICISPSWSIVDGLGGLFEFRYDWSNQDVFTGTDGTPKDNQVSTAVEFTYGF